jgi:FkbM family methyltransferase
MSHSKYNPKIEREDADAAQRLFSSDVKRLLTETSIVLDVGANRGQFASEILSIVDVKKIFSFEPTPNSFQELEKLSRSKDKIVPINAAVSTKSPFVTFFVTSSDIGSSLLRPLPGQPSKWLDMEEEIIVGSIRLDDFLAKEFSDHIPPIDLLKCDAQGADVDVLESAGEELNPARIKSVLVEVNFVEFYEGQGAYHEVFSLLDRRGYRLARLYLHRAHDDWLWMADALFIAK